MARCFTRKRLGRSSIAHVCAGVMCALLACFTGKVHALPNQATEYEVKAAFIYNFARFAEWPPSAFGRPSDPIRLCVFGKDPFGEILDDTVRGKTVAQHSFVVIRITDAAKTRDCHIVFIGRSESFQLGAVLAAVRDRPVMTIVDMNDAVQRGAILNFTLQDGRVRFAVNTDSAKRSGIALSSQLIKLATVVAKDTTVQ